MFCDLLIAYAYSKIGIIPKAKAIYEDVQNVAETSAIFNILLISQYLLAKLQDNNEKALFIINDSLALLRKQNNQSKILYALFEKAYIDVVKTMEITSIDLETEEQKLVELKTELAFLLEQ